jgi:DUF4097 and DUF4098 domain-containing protein YvlB
MRTLLSLLLVLPFCGFASAGENRSHTNTVAMNDDAPGDDCAQHLRVYNDDYRASARDEEAQTVPNQPLTITAEHNGGIHVTTWDKPEISLKLCKQVAAEDEATARKILNDTKLQISGGNVTISSPDSTQEHSLGTLLLVKAPKGASLDMSVHNGGISVNGFSGTAKVHARNGGISLKRSSGTLVAEAQNGGVSIRDCSGDVSANVQNGGLSISLPEQWEGKGLEAHTHNGGLVVAVPKNLTTAVEIAGSEHTSIICKDDVCNDAQRTWDNGRKMLRFGSGNPLIHATTVNGGVVVQARRAEL